jgi:hypothetical protein
MTATWRALLNERPFCDLQDITCGVEDSLVHLGIPLHVWLPATRACHVRKHELEGLFAAAQLMQLWPAPAMSVFPRRPRPLAPIRPQMKQDSRLYASMHVPYPRRPPLQTPEPHRLHSHCQRTLARDKLRQRRTLDVARRLFERAGKVPPQEPALALDALHGHRQNGSGDVLQEHFPALYLRHIHTHTQMAAEAGGASSTATRSLDAISAILQAPNHFEVRRIGPAFRCASSAPSAAKRRWAARAQGHEQRALARARDADSLRNSACVFRSPRSTCWGGRCGR